MKGDAMTQDDASARAFRAGWATGFQEGVEGAMCDGPTDGVERPVRETAALERWLFVEAASRRRAGRSGSMARHWRGGHRASPGLPEGVPRVQVIVWRDWQGLRWHRWTGHWATVFRGSVLLGPIEIRVWR